ncbi:DUF456 domain-containing protein [Flavobacterium turcicum]|uniref:DUF456 domain-containing protein n=1 Tax=Flavobacterium turcicum TaxID=2764718 RepID=A0ABR7JH63_9FLAO|nr:DUF456 domain-containing protein [Flavobacterium turcicum]MBC5863837.1 DUF456 domain-containing protein [Flavobacterium turcicum]NHL02215.1 DUF456 domain-containing protein [Flavobacterium turcicum]
MDVLLLLLGLLSILLGIAGSFLPVLPGAILSWLGLLLLYLIGAVPMNYWVVGITFLITIVLSVLDYVIPAQGTKKFGGSSYGIWGTNIGLVVGLLAPIPFGFIIGPFIGALVGELLYDSKNQQRAVKAAVGSLVGFLASSFIQFVFGCMCLSIYLWLVWENRVALF